MKKARIILSVIALFAFIGGALAFKAYRTSVKFLTSTSQYTSGALVYTAVQEYCIHPALFATNVITNPVAQGYTTSVTYPSSGSAQFFSGTLTITLPTYVCDWNPIATRVTTAN